MRAPTRTAAVVLLALLVGLPAARAADDPAVSIEQAVEWLHDGHTTRAEAALRHLAQAGDAQAMERLGIWHLYGERLLGPGPWDRREAVLWLGRAAEQGRPVARSLMLRAAAASTAGR
jgi:TPR repeat protein